MIASSSTVSGGSTRKPGASLIERVTRSPRAVDWAVVVLVGLLAAALYLRTLAPGLLGGDSGEFQFAAWLGGIAHPTGYPLYLLLGYLWSHLLRIGDPAWRMNAFSALWAALAVGLTYLLALRTLQMAAPMTQQGALVHRLTALFAAFAFAVSPAFWSQAVIAEVYTLNAVFLVLVLLGLVAWGLQSEAGAGTRPRPHCRPLYWVALAFGFSLAHHRSTLLLLPAISVYLWQNRRRSEPWRVRLVGLLKGLPLIGLPLLLYLYIPLRGPQTPYATIMLGPDQILRLYQPTLQWFVTHVTGQVFQAAIRPVISAAGQLGTAGALLVREMSWIGVALGAIGVVWLAFKCRPLLSLTGLIFIAVFAFNLFYGIGDIYVYYIPAYLVWVLWMSVGLGGLAALLGALGRSPGARRVLSLLPPALALVLPAWLCVTRYAVIDQSRNTAARQTWQRILARPLPQGAILVSNDRDEVVPLWYLQYVEGIRPDIAGLFPLLQPTAEWSDVGQVIDTALRSGRPIFLIKPMPGMEVKFRTEPLGPLVRVVGLAIERPPMQTTDSTFGGAVRLAGFDVEPDQVKSGDTITVTLYWQPLRRMLANYTTFVHLVNADGRVVGQSDHRPGGVYYPTGLWRPGEMLRDAHVLTLAAELGTSPYDIEVGLYTGISDLQHLGKPERVGQVAATQPSDLVP